MCSNGSLKLLWTQKCLATHKTNRGASLRCLQLSYLKTLHNPLQNIQGLFGTCRQYRRTHPSLLAKGGGLVVMLHHPWQTDLLKHGFVSFSHTMCRCTLNHLYFVPLPVLVDVFLGTRCARAQTSKSVPTKYSSISIRPATTGPLPIKVKFL